VVLQRFRREQAAGGLPQSDPSRIQRRRIPGRFNFIGQFLEGHFAGKRKSVPSTDGSENKVVLPFDPSAVFDFTKVDEREQLLQFSGLEADGIDGAVLINTSPLAVGHVLLLPRPQ
ncbi:unnamed protein product, partial [Polarella glacialis]